VFNFVNCIDIIILTFEGDFFSFDINDFFSLLTEVFLLFFCFVFVRYESDLVPLLDLVFFVV